MASLMIFGQRKENSKNFLTDWYSVTYLAFPFLLFPSEKPVFVSADETYWNINTAGIFRTSYGAKKKVVYNRHATDKQSAETVEASLSEE